MLLMFRVAVPTFFTVMSLVLLVFPTITLPKFKFTGLISTLVPVPVREDVWGLFGALSLTLRVAVRVLTACGAKETLMVQLAPAARVDTHVPPGWIGKSPGFAPMIIGEMPIKVAVPLLVNVNAIGGLTLPSSRIGNDAEVGVNEAPG